MIRTAPAIGWSALAGAAIAASALPLTGQLGFAILAIGVVGMAHGASDLAIVAPPRRPLFLVLYAMACSVCLVWWIADPAVALPAFLIASAIHFGLEDAPGGSIAERIARGVSLVATPAALHGPSLTTILHLAGAPEPQLPAMVGVMAVAGALTAGALLIVGVVRRDLRLVAGTAALLILPPLIGFSVGFLVLHALPQTDERRVRLGCPTIMGYLRAIAPILMAAVGLVVLAGIVLLHWDHSGIRPLFAGIAALAIPHLLVTPWFEGVPAPARQVAVMVPAR